MNVFSVFNIDLIQIIGILIQCIGATVQGLLLIAAARDHWACVLRCARNLSSDV